MTVMSVQSNHTRRPTEQQRFQSALKLSECQGLRHGTIDVVSSNLIAPTVQNCMVYRLIFWTARSPRLRNVNSYDRRHLKVVGTVIKFSL